MLVWPFGTIEPELAAHVAGLAERLGVDDPVGLLVEGDDPELVARGERGCGSEDGLLADVGLLDARELAAAAHAAVERVAVAGIHRAGLVDHDDEGDVRLLLPVPDAHVDGEELLHLGLRVAAGAVGSRPADHDHAAPEIADEGLQRGELGVVEAQPRNVDDDDAVVVEEVREVRRQRLRDHITQYADRLLADFDLLASWPEHVVTMQRNWIGRSEGAEVLFRCEELGSTSPSSPPGPTRSSARPSSCSPPSTPELLRLTEGTRPSREVRAYVDAATRARPPRTRRGGARQDRRPARADVVNPVNGEQIPMFVADYVLMEYGTGAIMAVPAHDDRDFAFAEAFGLEILRWSVDGPPTGRSSGPTSRSSRTRRTRGL